MNPAPERGQASSMALAVALPAHCVLIALVDQPDLDPAVLRVLRDAASNEPHSAHVPVFRGERGHPIVLPTSLAPAFAAAQPGESARELIARSGVPVREHSLDAPGILCDLDTPDDFARWASR